jgi:hypothetical protein
VASPIMAPWEKYAQPAGDGPWAKYGGSAAPQPEQPSLSGADTAEDIARSGVTGVIKGGAALAGLPGDIAEMGARGLDRATRFVGGALGVDVEQRPDQAPTYGSQAALNAVEPYTEAGKFYKPQTTAGKYAQTVGEFVPGMIGGPVGVGRRALTNVVAPGLASEAAGQATEGSAAEPYARVAGAVAGGLAPGALSRAISPLPINAERAAAVNTLRNEGVTDLTAGQITGRQPLKYLEAERGRGGNLMESQGEQFTQAAMRRVGSNAQRATPEAVDEAFTRLGTEFNYLTQNSTARFDRALAGELGQARAAYDNIVAPPNRVPAVENFLQEITEQSIRNGGTLPGEAYQSLRSRMGDAERAMRQNNSEAAHAIGQMREALDDAMERTLRAAGQTDHVQAWQQARRDYRNLLVIERTVAGSEGAAAGIISPAKLEQATRAVQGQRNYARGRGDFSELARAGRQVMTPLPNSGTAGRISAQNLGTGALAIGGALGGSAYGGGDPAMTLAGMLAGGLIPRAAGRAATSAVGRRYLANQLAAPAAGARRPPGQNALINALMAAQQQRLEFGR